MIFLPTRRPRLRDPNEPREIAHRIGNAQRSEFERLLERDPTNPRVRPTLPAVKFLAIEELSS